MKQSRRYSLRLQALILSIAIALTFAFQALDVVAVSDENNELSNVLDSGAIDSGEVDFTAAGPADLGSGYIDSGIVDLNRNQDQTENSDIVRTLTLHYMLKDSSEFLELLPPYQIKDGLKVEKYHAKYKFKLNDNIDTQTGEPQRTLKNGDYYLINLPEKLNIKNPKDGDILGNANEPIANYSFVKTENGTWQIKVTFTDYIDNPNEFDIFGEMEFDFELDLSAEEGGTTSTISIPIDNENNVEIEITIPEPQPNAPVSLTKTASSYNHLTRELVWNVKIMPETGVFSGCVFTDTIDRTYLDLASIKHGNITLTEGKDYTFDDATGKITYTIPDGRDGKDYQNITITTVAKRGIYGNTTATTVQNQANLSGGTSDVDIDSNTASHTITPDWLKKKGSLYQGNRIVWTITANSTRQLMYNAVITDLLQADVKLDKNLVYLGSQKVTIYDNAHTPADDKEIYGVLVANSDGTSQLKIYLPRGKENASDAVQTITLVTDIVLINDSPTEQNQVYSNSASLEANYVTDGDGEGSVETGDLSQIGVSVPDVFVDKSHNAILEEDKRNGTITWKISAASNHSSYGKSQIIDSLPEDQEYIADEIYWGEQKINSTTEPKAEISADGRTLTITFNNPNALRTQQNFTVKTKIKPEIYGDNLNRVFTNKVQCVLLDTEGNAIADREDTDTVWIQNSVISKTVGKYNGNTTKVGINPRVEFKIIVNKNLMPLSNVVITDDLNNIVTEFRKSGESQFTPVNGVKWTYVADTLKIVKSKGARDNLDLNAIANAATYQDNIITVNFGSGAAVNDEYTITFTAEIDILNTPIFKENGTIRCRGNIAEVTAVGLKPGTISTPPTGNTEEIKNEVLGKSGITLIKEQQVQWTINLNQRRVQMDSTKVVDVLPKGLTLDPTSIKLYKNVIDTDGNFITGNLVEAKGEEVTNFSYTYLPAEGEGMEGRYTLTVDLPDNKTDYILRFSTDFDDSLLGDNKKINNSAYFVGEVTVPSNTDTTTVTLSSTAGGGSTTKTSVTVNKRSKDSDQKIEGAVFELHWLPNGGMGTPVLVRTLAATNGSVIFRGLTRGEVYTVTEKSAPSGYLLDNAAPVTVYAPSDGTGDAEPLDFYNTPIKTGSWKPGAIKRLDGKDIIRPFDFEITDGINVVMTGTTKNKLSNGDYTVEFTLNDNAKAEDILKFTDDHIFENNDTEYLVTTKTFTMKEKPADLPGYGFDKTVHTLVVKVYNVKGRGALKVVIEDDKGNVLSDNDGSFLPDRMPKFTNTYTANGEIQLSAEKKVLGHSLATNQFSFELYEKTKDGETIVETVGNQAGRNVEHTTYIGNIAFSPIGFTQKDVGIKTYIIKEKHTSLEGYTYDPSVYTVTIEVTDQDNGKLSGNILSTKKSVNGVETDASNIQFTNTYIVAETDVILTAKKALSGRNLQNEQFSFILNQTTPDGAFIKQISTVKNIGENVSFPKLTFTQTDIGKSYYYQMSETNDSKAGYSYDNAVYSLRIDVNDREDGTLKIAQTITKGDGEIATEMIFNNAYKAAGSSLIKAVKTLSGKTIPKEQFSFALQQIDITNGNALGERVIVKNDAEGNVVFPAILYTEADAGKSFYYTVCELNDGVGGYTYDSTVYTVCVSVTDNGDGTLNTQQAIVTPAGKTSIEFANAYKTINTAAGIEGTKVLNRSQLTEGQFHFVLNQVTEAGELVQKIQQVSNAQDGQIKFDDIVFTQADMGKTYYYQVSEVTDQKDSDYQYDESVYLFIIDVIDNGDGTLSTNQTIKKGNIDVEKAIFTNTYILKSAHSKYTAKGSVSLSGTKVLQGAKLTDKMFQFVLTDENNQILQTAFNDVDGNVLFDKIYYNQNLTGRHIYSIREIQGDKAGITYDGTEYTVTIDVSDNGDGSLKIESSLVKVVNGKKVNADAIEFVNKYQTTMRLNNPETGDSSFVMLFAVAGLVSFSVLLLLTRKKVKRM